MGVEGCNNQMNQMRVFPVKISDVAQGGLADRQSHRSFGMTSLNPNDDMTYVQKFQGIGSQRLSCFSKIYKLIKLKTSIVIIKKYYPVSLA